MDHTGTEVLQKWLDPSYIGFTFKKLLAFIAISVCVLGGALLLGPYPITEFSVDTAYVLIQGDYLNKGFRPYVDYFSLHGPFPFLFFAIGMWIYGVSLRAIVFAQVLAAALFGSLMFRISVNRVQASWSVFFATCIELIIISCTPLGSRTWRDFSCAMWYNTIAFSIMAIVFLFMLVPSVGLSKRSRIVDCGIIGTCLAFCFLTKVSFFVPTLIVFVVGTVLWPREKEMRFEGIVALVVSAVTVVAIMGLLGGSLSGYYHFLHSLPLKQPPILLPLRYVHYTSTLGVFALSMVLVGWMAYDVGLGRKLYREWVLALLMFGAIVTSASTACQDMEILPMLGILPLGIIFLIVRLVAKSGRKINIELAVPAMLASLLLIVHAPKNAALSWFFSHISVPTFVDPVKRYSLSDVEAMDLKLSPEVDLDLLTMMPRTWVDQYAAAIRLLNESSATESDVVYVATTSSSFGLLSGFKSAVGQVAWWPDVFLSGPEKFALIDDAVLEDTKWLLRDKKAPYCWNYLRYHRGQYIDDNFETVGENDNWQLYRRKK